MGFKLNPSSKPRILFPGARMLLDFRIIILASDVQWETNRGLDILAGHGEK
jgi:hypothetical protein